jgi:hypothetical protein
VAGLYPDQITPDSFEEILCYDGTTTVNEIQYESPYDYKKLNGGWADSTITFLPPQ